MLEKNKINIEFLHKYVMFYNGEKYKRVEKLRH